MDRILIFELNWMGDILFSFPFIRALRQRFPDAYITCTVVPRYFELLVHNPWVNYVHVLSDDKSLLSIGEKISFVGMIKDEGFDTCFLLKSSRTRGVMAQLAGIPVRIGFSGKKAPLTREVDVPEGLHRADQILALAGVAGVHKADGAYEYFFSEEDEERANDILRGCGGGIRRTVALNPGGNWEMKKWGRDNFTELARRIISSFGDTEVMITGAQKDVPVAEEITRDVGSNRCYSVAGKTGLNELAVLFKESALVVSADSGPLHLASATGATTIGLYGPTSVGITGPRGRGRNIVIKKEISCRIPCYTSDCGLDMACMRAITVDEVFKSVRDVLEGA